MQTPASLDPSRRISISLSKLVPFKDKRDLLVKDFINIWQYVFEEREKQNLAMIRTVRTVAD